MTNRVGAPRHFSLGLLCAGIVLLFVSGSALAQGAKRAPFSPQNENDADRAEQREQWFRRGRTGTAKTPAARLRYQAQQQKLQQRAERRAQADAAAKAAAVTGAKAAAPSTTSWVPLGPAPLASDWSGIGFQDYRNVSGRATSVVIDRADATGNTVYLGGAYGGVWKSINAASPDPTQVVWTPVLDDQPSLAVGAIGIQAGNSDPTRSVVLVGTGEPNSAGDSYYGVGILRSADGGGTWTLIDSADSGSRPFAGTGFSKIAFSSKSGSTGLAVASTATAYRGVLEGLDNNTGVNRGLYYTTDAGLDWHFATVKDSGVTVEPGSATDVVYNATNNTFYAALRFHGIYSSIDGINWTRLAKQPGAGLTTTACPANPHSSACPIYRAQLAVVPGRNEMYVWVVSLGQVSEVDGGIWRSADGGLSWTQLGESGLTSCGEPDGCGVSQGFYNLELAAVPSGTVTDLYAGAINLFKCTNVSGTNLNCKDSTWLNLTHVYGCDGSTGIVGALAHVHPDQHGVDFLIDPSGHDLMYFANDGGIYRALDGFTGLTTGSCTGTNSFDSLNTTLGSMTQFVSFSTHPTDADTMVGGTQDNGSPASASATTSGSFLNVNGGDGGYNAINPNNPTEWYTANTDVSIQRCSSGIACHGQDFGIVVQNSTLSGDHGAFYTPYILDPQNSGKLIVGTCRAWRGNTDGSAFTALTLNLDKLTTATCNGGEVNLISALAAGGPTDSNGSKVLYIGTSGGGPALTGSQAGGRLWISTNAGGGTATFNDQTQFINPLSYPISDIAIDRSDSTGKTAYVTIMGFNVGHVWKTTDAGTTWSEFDNGLPDAPVNSVVVDPGTTTSNGTVYVGTDVGVFSSSTGVNAWSEVGPAPSSGSSGFLPNVPVTALRMFSVTGTKKLRASTYGRGIWEFNLVTTPDFDIVPSQATVEVLVNSAGTFNATATALNGYTNAVTLNCTAGATQPPSGCTPSPGTVMPTSTGVGVTVTSDAQSAVADFAFNLHGSDINALAHDTGLNLHVVDFGLDPPSGDVTVNTPSTSAGVTLRTTGAGSFDGTVTLSCAGLPLDATCSFSPSAVVSPTAASPVTATLTVGSTLNTPAGTSVVTVNAVSSVGAAVKAQTFNLTVTDNPDFGIAVNGNPADAQAGSSSTVSGTLTAFHNYASSVTVSCGSGGPPTCTPVTVTPTANGAAFSLTVQSDLAQSYSFAVVGTDAANLSHSSSTVTFNSIFGFSSTADAGSKTVTAGSTATYTFDLTPAGNTTFPGAVTFSVSGLPTLTTATFSPTQIAAGAGKTTVTLSVKTTAPIAGLRSPAPGWMYAMWLPLPGMVVLLAGCFGKNRRWKRIALYVALAVALTLMLTLTACGGGGGSSSSGGGQPGTPAGTYPLSITATSGSNTTTTTATLVVN